MDPVFAHLRAGKVYVVEGDTREVVGMMNVGHTANMAIAPDHGELFIGETYWERGTRGPRIDLVTSYDPRTLDVGEEVELPAGRGLIVPKRRNLELTPDGRFLLSFNMDPATSVSVVDVEERRYVGELDALGCALIFPSASDRFSMLCTDGSLLTVVFTPEGETVSAEFSEPFFDAENDPVFESAGVSKADGRVYFVSYAGRVHPVDLGDEEPQFDEPWWLTSEQEREEGWRPGGWQLVTLHQSANRLFVLMHQGEQWTHRQPGDELWVFDVDSGERVDSLELEQPAGTVAVSQGPLEEAQLYLLAGNDLLIYNVEGLDAIGRVEAVGDTPLLLYVEGE
jgi:methylamine dehydrogenase heavy chain